MKKVIFKKVKDERFLEIHNNMLKDDKIVISLQKNENSKQACKVNYFLDTEDFLYLAHSTKTGLLFLELEEYFKNPKENKNPLELQVGNFLKKDNRYISRILRIKAATTKDSYLALEIIESDGQKDDTGAIIPVRNNVVRVCFNFTKEEFVRFILTIEAHYNAFLTIKYSFLDKKFFYTKEELQEEDKQK